MFHNVSVTCILPPTHFHGLQYLEKVFSFTIHFVENQTDWKLEARSHHQVASGYFGGF